MWPISGNGRDSILIFFNFPFPNQSDVTLWIGINMLWVFKLWVHTFASAYSTINFERKLLKNQLRYRILELNNLKKLHLLDVIDLKRTFAKLNFQIVEDFKLISECSPSTDTSWEVIIFLIMKDQSLGVRFLTTACFRGKYRQRLNRRKVDFVHCTNILFDEHITRFLIWKNEHLFPSSYRHTNLYTHSPKSSLNYWPIQHEKWKKNQSFS